MYVKVCSFVLYDVFWISFAWNDSAARKSLDAQRQQQRRGVDRGDNDVAAIVEEMSEVLDDHGTNSAQIYFWHLIFLHEGVKLHWSAFIFQVVTLCNEGYMYCLGMVWAFFLRTMIKMCSCISLQQFGTCQL